MAVACITRFFLHTFSQVISCFFVLCGSSKDDYSRVLIKEGLAPMLFHLQLFKYTNIGPPIVWHFNSLDYATMRSIF